VEIYHHKKLGVNPPRGYCPHIREIAQHPKHPKPLKFECLLLLFSQFLRRSTDALVGPIFTFNTSYDVVLRKVVPFGVKKINFKI